MHARRSESGRARFYAPRSRAATEFTSPLAGKYPPTVGGWGDRTQLIASKFTSALEVGRSAASSLPRLRGSTRRQAGDGEIGLSSLPRLKWGGPQQVHFPACGEVPADRRGVGSSRQPRRQESSPSRFRNPRRCPLLL